jgi:DNA-binding NtrC family response regulator
MNRNVLVVDDEEIQADIIANILEKETYTVKKAHSAEEAIKIISKLQFSVLLVDLKMPGIGGLGLLKHCTERGLESKLIIMTAYGTIDTAVEAMKNGAFDYITKPFNKDVLLLNVEKAVNAYSLYQQNVRLKEELSTIYEERKLVGVSDAIKSVYELIDKISASDNVNVFITGESGTGKELVAREIHARSSRAYMPFVPVNCSAIPENLLESELFGYEVGAFTGAVSKREGKFRSANGGTLFFDEVADMALNMQVKLLRAIQDKEITPVGGDEPYSVDVRIISATNKNIEEMVEQGLFRDDLYYRLNVIPIHIPSLRERREDIPLLAEYICQKLTKKLKKNSASLSQEVIAKLKSYSFPGNVRELENILERAFILAGEEELGVAHFPILRSKKYVKSSLSADSSLKNISKNARERAEEDAIKKALNDTQWNRVKAAHILNVDYKTLRKKMKELNINPEYKVERKGS